MQIVIIGAGVGGMTAALRLAHAGHAVTVVEQGERVGGKLNLWEPEVPGIGAFRFDTGPHVLTMPWAIAELFADLGERMEEHLDLVRMNPICRYHFADSPVFDAPADPEEAARRVAERFPGDESGFRDLLEYARRINSATVAPFLRQDFAQAVRGIPTGAQWRQLAEFVSLAPWETLHKRIERHLHHPQLKQIFDLYAFYNGSSPFKASAIYAIIAWIQWGEGTFYLRGGLRTFATALETMAIRRGISLRLNTPVRSICIEGAPGRGKIAGVEIASGEVLPADVVICNSDPLTTYEKLIPSEHCPAAYRPENLAKLEPSTSAFVLLLGVRGETRRDFGHLAHFNSFLPDSPTDEYAAIFEQRVPGNDPVVGVTCQSVTEENCAPPGYTNLFVMTSPPPLGDHFTWDAAATASYRARILHLLETRCQMPGLCERIVCEQVWTPRTFADRYGSFRGSLYGLSSNSWRSGFLRPPTQARETKGLFFVGGGTHPGGGLPLVTLGGKIVADSVLRASK